MTLTEFYDQLERHDWYHAMSDDHRVWQQGQAARLVLSETADAGGPAYQALLEAYSNYVFTGPSWGTDRKPKPPQPIEE